MRFLGSLFVDLFRSLFKGLQSTAGGVSALAAMTTLGLSIYAHFQTVPGVQLSGTAAVFQNPVAVVWPLSDRPSLNACPCEDRSECLKSAAYVVEINVRNDGTMASSPGTQVVIANGNGCVVLVHDDGTSDWQYFTNTIDVGSIKPSHQLRIHWFTVSSPVQQSVEVICDHHRLTIDLGKP